MTSTWQTTPRMKAYVIAAPFGLKSTTDRCAAGSVRGITANIPSDLIFSWTRNLSLTKPIARLKIPLYVFMFDWLNLLNYVNTALGLTSHVSTAGCRMSTAT
ncbi:hypothetical protein HCDG_03626 [Histoplasma capsulatum H143]|uniref:Uncharacterized protein n=1 Tax=Ajellomyces capsulatus (strain H143) TaxID=544712 RepID=C6HC77_AJECH|nr:hypothetical protein HCDG_03626 [Histoplasma capsulatum H143]